MLQQNPEQFFHYENKYPVDIFITKSTNIRHSWIKNYYSRYLVIYMVQTVFEVF